ncbi:hypothetical protein F2Q65_06500 [Thiohalocapsa marina]|uniref:DUF4148 domain-containing protein n=1 Tax=Thiohalocapsa marina TaxID=424902 RepID=A0A5M8FNG6_9GAMM|nr:hypothetical protein [Thiohalocapsa marina]KAA6186014.1 hypothetical protein F2Q65_06500 [Thiohalocapsa marina]
MTRSALIVGALLTGLLLQPWSHPATAQAQAQAMTEDSSRHRDEAHTRFGQRGAPSALDISNQSPSPSIAAAQGGEVGTPLSARATIFA